MPGGLLVAGVAEGLHASSASHCSIKPTVVYGIVSSSLEEPIVNADSLPSSKSSAVIQTHASRVPDNTRARIAAKHSSAHGAQHRPSRDTTPAFPLRARSMLLYTDP